MALTKKQRQEVWNKTNGRCWWCGCDLPKKGWHADHIKPIFRQTDSFRDNGRYVTKQGGALRPENDNFENIVPSCAPCNLFKTVLSVEVFRAEISEQVKRARKTSVNFRTAERFGLIEAVEKPVVFWFETELRDCGHNQRNKK